MADQGKRLIYQDDEGLKVVIPPHDEDADLTWEQIACIFVPVGFPYKIIDVAEVPSDRSQRVAWTVDPIDLTDGEPA